MNTLERLREELRQMEEANSRGQLNENELNDLERLREEVSNLEQNAIEERENQIREYETNEIENLFRQDEWYQSHIDELNEMRAAKDLPSFSEQDKIDLQTLENEFNERRKQVSDRYIQNKMEEIENLFRQDEWYQSHIDELNEMRAAKDLPSFSEQDKIDLQTLENEFDERRKAYIERYNNQILTSLNNSEIEELIPNQTDSNTNENSKEKEHQPQHMKPESKEHQPQHMKSSPKHMKEHQPQHMTPTDDELGYENMSIKELMAERDKLRNLLNNTGIRLEQYLDSIRHRIELIEQIIAKKMRERRNLPPAEETQKGYLPEGDSIKGYLPEGEEKEIDEEQKTLPPGIKGYLPPAEEETIIIEPPIQKPEKKEIRTWERILQEVQEESELSDVQFRHVTAKNIVIRGQARAMLKDAPNIVYKSFGLTRIARTKIGSIFVKLYGNITFKEEDQIEYDKLKNALDKLSDSDLEILIDEYRSQALTDYMNTKAVNKMIQDRLERYLNEKADKINSEIENLYIEAMGLIANIEKIKEEKSAGRITEQDYKLNMAMIEDSSAENIVRQIRDKQREVLEIRGKLNGLTQDFKADKTNMNLTGRVFASRAKEQTEEFKKVNAEQANLADAEKLAIENGDPIEALEAFANYERFKRRHSATKKDVIRGERTVGEKQFHVIDQGLDYRDDPLLRDVISTVGTITAIVSIANAVKVEQENAQLLREHQSEVAKANAQNQAFENQVHQSGKTITDQAPSFRKGLEYQGHQASLAYANTTEVDTLRHNTLKDPDSGFVGAMRDPDYTAMDEAVHEDFNRIFAQTDSGIKQVAKDINAGSIDEIAALSEIGKVVTSAQQEMDSGLKQCLQDVLAYQQVLPQFDITAVRDTLQMMINNPDAVPNMVNSMETVLKTGQSLQGMTVETVQAMQAVSSDLIPTLVAASASLVAARELEKTIEKGIKENKYSASKEAGQKDSQMHDQDNIMKEAEERYYNMGKLKRAMATIQWHKFLKLKEKESLDAEETEEVKGMFRSGK